MRKIIRIVLPILVLLFVFSLVKVNADTPNVSTFDGAQIRTTDPAGLRFAGSVDEAFEGNAKYGFIASKGEYTAEEMIANYNSSCAVFIDCDGIDAENKYYLNIINIPATGFESDITVLACVDVDGVKTYATNSVTRNIKEVAEAAVSDPGYTTNEYIEKIVKTSTFVLDGGEFVAPLVEIGAFNAGNDGKSGITLCTKGNASKGSGQYWYRVFLKQNGYNSNVFTVVQTVEAGVKFDASTVDCDYIIAAYGASDVTNLKALANKEYIYISDIDYEFAKASDNYELLVGNKWLVKDGDTLPLATKQYFDFGGWYGNDSFEGDPITTKSGDNAETFYAKYSYTNYTIKYYLDGGLYDGASSIANGNYTYATPTFSLPSSLLMTKEDYTFVEWNTKADGSGDTLTEITVGSHGNLDIYAIWAADTPTEVELSAADSAAITAYNPTKFVKSNFTAGKFTIAGDTYKVGDGELFTNIASALSEASANDVIYVFGGTYSSDITISTAGVKIVGPNQNKVGYSDSRVTEANIAGMITIGANNVELIGIQLSGTSKAITWTSTISNLTIKNVKSTASGKSTNGGRIAIIASDAGITNLVIDGMYIKCTGTAGRDGVAIYGTTTGFKLINSEFDNGATSYTNSEVVRINYIAGVAQIENNKFTWSTANMSVFLGGTSNSCTKMTFVNNILKGSSTAKCTTFGYRNVPSGCTVDVIGNWFEYFDTGNTLSFKDKTGSIINIKYNYFGTGVAYSYSDAVAGTKTQTNNYYKEAQTTTTSDVSTYASLDELIAAYEASTEYTTYGSECVYSN